MAFFPIVHSILDARALGAAVQDRYAIAVGACRLAVRGNADIYGIETEDGERHAVRVWNALANAPAWPIAYELEFARYLATHGAAIPPVRAARDGSLSFTVEAPEGVRSIAVFGWADGVLASTCMTEDIARRIGRATAELHCVAARFRPVTRPRVRDDAGAIRACLPALLKVVERRPGEAELYTRAARQVTAQLDRLVEAMRPLRQAIHADIHPDNVLIDGRGRITLVDFDSMAEDIPLKDVIAFLWRCRYGDAPAWIGANFLAGYESVRPLSPAERDAMPLLMAARDLVVLTSIAARVNSVGNTAVGYTHDLDRYRESISGYLRENA